MMSRVCIRFFTRNGYNTVGPSTPFYTQPRCFCRSTLGPFLARLKRNKIYKGLSGALVAVGILTARGWMLTTKLSVPLTVGATAFDKAGRFANESSGFGTGIGVGGIPDGITRVHPSRCLGIYSGDLSMTGQRSRN